ncbi:hybrid sensor histidine kinase/response regulator transcription factor [Flavobacterium sp. 14A]|uniref:hybrid sensor histidine kinase/response regulator transcription factor n=1 Tax=Flavobacterium sp. 14A TaxID=2735896 RepID=UPI0020C704F1|nr:hybrid sensor histidine kinase/response regulator transcription factor [Flavobacterium sp. 14A]NRT10483.1 signal transduction histidine kinase/ligand-binding sensor domain-containing protein/DNA-binding response OmpR family regulator [Flavobacterium sp. 14A]
MIKTFPFFKILILFIMLSIVTNVAHSQKLYEGYQFININEGISKRGVSCITQDQYGYMWIGTFGAGLYKYDGLSYTVFENDWQKDSSIISNIIYCTYVDSNNKLWVGTDQGLCFYNRELNKFETIDLKIKQLKGGKSDVPVKSIIQDNSGNLIIGTFGRGILKFNLKTSIISFIDSEVVTYTNYQVNCFTKAVDGTIYVGTSFGLKSLQAGSKIVKNVRNAAGESLVNEHIESIVLDRKQNIWLGTFYNGLVKVSRDVTGFSKNSFPITKKRVMAMLQAEGNAILCATENDGLFLVDIQGAILKKYLNNKTENNSLKSNSVWSLFSDKENRIWLGYYNQGVDVFDKLYSKFNAIGSNLYNKENSLQARSVTGIVKDKVGKLWISLEGGGVDYYDPIKKLNKHVNSKNASFLSGLKSDDIQTVFLDSKENVWLGSWDGGIYFLKKGSNNFVNYNTGNTEGIASNRMLSFSEDSNGIIWIGTYLRGLHYYVPSQNKFYHCDSPSFSSNGLTNGDVRKVLVDSNDRIWLGSTLGLFLVTHDNNFKFKVVALKNQMMKDKKMQKNQSVLSLYESQNKKIWIGTDGAGLFSFSPSTNNFDYYYNYKGLVEKSVAAIVEDQEGAIWISGKAGITKVDLKNKNAVNFTKDDGLLDNDFNNNSVLKDKNGDLYFGSYEGINYFNPKQISKSAKQPLLYFSDFKLFNKSVSPNDVDSPLSKVISETDHLVLKYDQSVFTIEFIGLNYSHPGKNEYAYYLEGFEEEWNFVGGKRAATYTNLPAGKYIFNVKASKRGGVWSEKPLQLHIEVLPPFWRTTFAYFLYLLAFILLSLYMKKFLQNRFEEKQAIQFERDKAVQIEKLNAKKLQFFTNISHEFRTPLTLIINPLEDILKNKSFGLPAEVLNKLFVIHKSSDRLSRLINELMDFNKLQFNKMALHVQQVEVVGFTKNIVSYFEEEAASRAIDLQFESTVESLQDWLDPKMFEKIIFNIISNAFKVTADSGKIKVSINASQKMIFLPLANTQNKVETFEIAIEDTGAGLNKKEIKRIFDRFYQVNNLNKTYYGSTGIGLEVVRGFVELHKGKIEVDSTLGVGTTFTVVFPLGNEYFTEAEILDEEHQVVLRESIKKAVVDEKAASDTVATTAEITHTILIVEDNTELRNYLKDELKKSYKVIVAENGQKGFELAKQKLPDLILTDVIMPVMNGLELCKAVKADLKTSHIPLLMLSAKALVQDKLEGIDSGADMYMSKPFDMDVLKSSLGQLINSRQIMFDKFYKGITKNTKEKTTTLDNDFIQKTLTFIHENISDSDLSVEVLASKVFLSRSQLYRKIKTLTGVSVNEFIRNVRLEKAKELIQLGDSNINEISYIVGFASPSYFTKCYKAKYGELPTDFEKNKLD